MKAKLEKLIERAKKLPPMTAEEREEQAINFAAGNCALSDKQGRSLEFWVEMARRARKVPRAPRNAPDDP